MQGLKRSTIAIELNVSFLDSYLIFYLFIDEGFYSKWEIGAILLHEQFLGIDRADAKLMPYDLVPESFTHL
ncbi:MAG: hypothetical protein ACI9D5_001462 [Candidatus Endobugula sp.]|jgi:hypothetical protein